MDRGRSNASLIVVETTLATPSQPLAVGKRNTLAMNGGIRNGMEPSLVPTSWTIFNLERFRI